LGGFFRFYNLNWDEGQLYHPDERNVAAAVSRIEFPTKLDPEFYAYNGLPIYLYHGIGTILSLKGEQPLSSFLASLINPEKLDFQKKDFSWTYDWSKINLIGRFFSALSATISIYLIYLLGKLLMGMVGGVLSATLLAFSPSLIQQAHFGVTESLLLFFLLLITFFATKFLKERKIIFLLFTAVFCGLALGTKISALSFLIIPSLSFLISFFREKKKTKWLLLGGSFLILSFLLFFLTSPYTFLNFSKFRESMEYENGVVTGKIKVPYNWQFSDTFPYLFFFKNLHWQTGIFVPTLGFLGIFFWLYFILKKKENILALPAFSFAIFYFAYVGSWYTKFVRYMIPLIPFLVLGTVWIILKLTQFQKTKLLGKILLIIVPVSSFLWSLAFFSIYTRPSTRIVASKWIYENVPKGSVLLVEHWDDRLPSPLPGYDPSQYIYLEMENYDADTPEKISKMAKNLEMGDFLILSSRRLYGSIGKNPQEWPITSKYYQKLFQGELGYVLVQKITSYPKLFWLEINDDSSEETFQVYDHPVIHIFQNKEKFSKEKLESILIN